jgi:hypothetical protein
LTWTLVFINFPPIFKSINNKRKNNIFSFFTDNLVKLIFCLINFSLSIFLIRYLWIMLGYMLGWSGRKSNNFFALFHNNINTHKHCAIIIAGNFFINADSIQIFFLFSLYLSQNVWKCSVLSSLFLIIKLVHCAYK